MSAPVRNAAMPTWRRFGRLARGFERRLLVGVLLLLVTNLLAFSLPWILQRAIDALKSGSVRTAPELLGFAGAMAGIAIVQAIIRTSSRWLILGASRRIVAQARERFFAHLLRLPTAFHDRHHVGDLMSRAVQDVALLRSVYGPGLLNLFNTAIAYLVALALMVLISPRLTLWALALYPLLLLAVNQLNRRAFRHGVALQELVGQLGTRAGENLAGIHQVRVYAQEQREIDRFAELSGQYLATGVRLARAQGAMVSLIGASAGVGTVFVLHAGSRMVMSGELTLGQFVAFNVYLAMLTWPTVALGWILNVFQRGVGALDRLEEIESLPSTATRAQPPVIEWPAGPLRVESLSFAYESRPELLRQLRLELPERSLTALVGEVGSGKSTLACLLAGVYPVDPNTVFLADRDLATAWPQGWRALVGLAPQEPFLFSRSIAENIVLDRELDVAWLNELVERSQLSRDLEQFPDGLETVVGERGVTVSGGQRQRIALARALYGRPQVLIIDDALSAVDATTEAAILAALRRDRHSTVLMITHRASAVRHADRVALLDQGRIAALGTHDELLVRSPAYARLMRRHSLEARLDQA